MSSVYENRPYNFISFDGVDENGVRAEVLVVVQVGATIISVNEGEGVAQIAFKSSNPKLVRPFKGWVLTEDSIFPYIQEAYKAGRSVNFRLEYQRKAKVDRSIPIKDLRKTIEEANTNTRIIVAMVDDHVSSEAVTNPNEDPKATGGRYVATDNEIQPNYEEAPVQNNVNDVLNTVKKTIDSGTLPQGVIDSLIAQALLAGATPEQITDLLKGETEERPPVRNVHFIKEAPPFKYYNADGSVNLGTASIGAVTGIQSLMNLTILRLAKEQDIPVVSIRNFEEALDHFTTLSLAICDAVQKKAYKSGKPDRGGASHTRIRSIFYDVIETFAPLPLVFKKVAVGYVIAPTVEGEKEWVRSAGTLTTERFYRVLNTYEAYPSFSEIGFLSEVPAPTTTENIEPPAVSEHPAETPQNEPVTSPVAQQENGVNEHFKEAQNAPKEDRKALAEKLIADTKTEQTLPTETEEDDSTSNEEPLPVDRPMVYDDVEIYPPVPYSKPEPAEKATPETVELFKDMLSSLGLDLNNKDDIHRISTLLYYTFGTHKATEVSDELLIDMIDHYNAFGNAALNKAIKLAIENG